MVTSNPMLGATRSMSLESQSLQQYARGPSAINLTAQEKMPAEYPYMLGCPSSAIPRSFAYETKAFSHVPPMSRHPFTAGSSPVLLGRMNEQARWAPSLSECHSQLSDTLQGTSASYQHSQLLNQTSCTGFGSLPQQAQLRTHSCNRVVVAPQLQWASGSCSMPYYHHYTRPYLLTNAPQTGSYNHSSSSIDLDPDASQLSLPLHHPQSTNAQHYHMIPYNTHLLPSDPVVLGTRQSLPLFGHWQQHPQTRLSAQSTSMPSSPYHPALTRLHAPVSVHDSSSSHLHRGYLMPAEYWTLGTKSNGPDAAAETGITGPCVDSTLTAALLDPQPQYDEDQLSRYDLLVNSASDNMSSQSPTPESGVAHFSDLEPSAFDSGNSVVNLTSETPNYEWLTPFYDFTNDQFGQSGTLGNDSHVANHKITSIHENTNPSSEIDTDTSNNAVHLLPQLDERPNEDTSLQISPSHVRRRKLYQPRQQKSFRQSRCTSYQVDDCDGIPLGGPDFRKCMEHLGRSDHDILGEGTLSRKLSIRIYLPGHDTHFTKQMTISSKTNRTRAGLARVISKVVHHRDFQRYSKSAASPIAPKDLRLKEIWWVSIEAIL